MTLETTIITNCTAGELSPLARSRVDTEKYYNGLETEMNLVSLPQGGATKRPGTKYVSYARDSWPGPLGGGVNGGTPISSVNAVRMFDFVFGVTQAYQIETAGLGVSRTVTGAANNGAGLVRLTMASTAGLFTGCTAVVSAVAGTTEANGTWTLTVIDATHVDLQASTFSNAYVSGGTLASNGGYARFYKDDGLIVNLLTVTGAANNGAGLIRLTVNSTTNLVTGNHAVVSAVTGTTEANGVWILTVIDGTHIDLQGSTFTHAYLSAGAVSVPVEIAIPYTSDELPAVGYVQSTDTVYFFHPTHAPMVLTRSSHTLWAIATLEVRDGPYVVANTTTTTVTPGGTTGSVTLTFSSTTGINNNAGLSASDIGRLVRIKDSAKWAWTKITGVTNGSVCTASVMASITGGADGVIDGTSPTTTWQLGAWSATTGFPFMAAFFQQRLFFLGTSSQANGFWGSVTNAFSSSFVTLSPTGNDGTVTATNGIAWLISDDQVNAGRWLSPAGSSQAPQMGIGTVGNEQIVQPASSSSALSATNVQVYKETQYGARFLFGTSINTQPLLRPLRIGKSVLFVNRAGRKLYDWQFNWQVNGYIAPDLMEWSEHITDPGVVQIVYQQNPFSVLWALLSNGQMISATYRPDQKVFAPSRHRLGGSFSGGGAPFVDSISVIPSSDGSYDALWLAAKRDLVVPSGVTTATITVRYIEVMANYFRQGNNGLAPEQAWFVDCGLQSLLTYPVSTCTPSARGVAGQAVSFTASPGIFAAGDVGKMIRMNNGKAVITTYNSAGSVDALSVVPFDSIAAQTSGNWSMTAASTDFGNLSHLGTSTVSVRGDGGKCPQAVISTSGHISLSPGASLVTAGLPYKPELLTMRYETAGSGPHTAAGRVKRIIDLYLRLFETSSCRYGPSNTATKLDQVLTRSANDLMGQAPPLLSDDFRVQMPGGSNKEGQIYATQDQDDAGPFTLLGVVADVDVGQRKAA